MKSPKNYKYFAKSFVHPDGQCEWIEVWRIDTDSGFCHVRNSDGTWVGEDPMCDRFREKDFPEPDYFKVSRSEANSICKKWGNFRKDSEV